MFLLVNRVSVNVLLKSVIAIMAATVMIVLAINAREACIRLAAVERIAVVADVSADMFTALHNLRVDRATTSRDLNADAQFATLPQQLIEVRGGDMPALKSAVVALAKADFPDKQSAQTSLSQAVSKLEALHQQTAAALAAPKSARPPGLPRNISPQPPRSWICSITYRRSSTGR